MRILQFLLLATIGYALYETADHFLGRLSQSSTNPPVDPRKRVTGSGRGARSATDGPHGQSSRTIVGRGVVSRSTGE